MRLSADSHEFSELGKPAQATRYSVLPSESVLESKMARTSKSLGLLLAAGAADVVLAEMFGLLGVRRCFVERGGNFCSDESLIETLGASLLRRE